MGRPSFPILTMTLLGLVVVLFLLSLAVGQVWINPLNGLFGASDNVTRVDQIILLQIRLPRAILGLAIGGILGLSGAVLQGLLRNPLAEPGVMGMSASASLGAVIAIYTGLTTAFAYALPIAALFGALFGVLLLLLLAGRSTDVLTLILSGVAITSLASALTSLALNLSSNPFASLEIVFWMLGSLTDRSMVHVWLSVPLILVGSVMLFSTARALDALSLGPDVARSLGVDMRRTRSMAIVGTAVGVGAATAVSGTIGFVGLIVPHLLRPLVGSRPSRLLPVSALGGAAFLLAADLFIRLVMPDKDLKLGVVTAIIGAPFFLWLLRKIRRRVV
ncbi:iron complex transport system permease protein [Cohaesibacter marisflavi]|uniref:Iron complex transport system permease protein n=2 Tax=Cohaesibacter marisflavi TaxID=655353 RepID=A0A1I5G4J6_9HYPH|nr:iron ABC transporter permease [Cohaesibacter marisflavi]SFO30917.1 iron complex transport system permease protein [Cohaesibacter marisflavi]